MTVAYAAQNAGGVLRQRMDAFTAQPMAVTGEGYYAVLGEVPSLALGDLSAELKRSPDGYEIDCRDDVTVLRSASARGVLYAFLAWRRGEQSGRYVPDSAFRAVHIDLRYGFWKEECWEALLDNLVSMRYNTLILESENRLPFASHPDVAPPESFTPESLGRLLSLCADRFLEVIPLQQTLGHLEYLLKLPAYNALREVRSQPEETKLFETRLMGAKHYHDFDEICPSDAAACAVVEELLGDAMTLFPDSRYVHIGCDEAWNLLYCDDCRAAYADKSELLTAHLNRVAAQVIAAGKTPIIWDDMLRRMSVEQLKQLDARIVVMSWLYFSHHPDAEGFLRRFSEAGLTVLGAATAKCSVGTLETLDIPDYSGRLGNVDWWVNTCDTYGIPGFAMTVWSNYSGQIAPPHPLFDTVWLPLYYGARRLWDHSVDRAAVLGSFCRDFFGVDATVEGLSAGALLPLTKRLVAEATANRDAATLWHLSVLLWYYRMKSASVGRELYRYRMKITSAERCLLDRRVAEVRRLRDFIYPRVEEALSKQYESEEVKLFLMARFAADDVLYAAFCS